MSKAYDWNETVENPEESTGGGGYTLLPPGNYRFRVIKVERGEFPGGAKTPACKKAIVHMEVDAGPHLGQVEIKEDLLLHSNCEKILCAFFLSIGTRKSGEALNIGHFQKAPGLRGIIKIGNRVATNKKGEQRTYNDVQWFQSPDTEVSPYPTAAAQPAPVQAAPAASVTPPAAAGWGGGGGWGAPAPDDEITFP
jgi:hypothetical protein